MMILLLSSTVRGMPRIIHKAFIQSQNRVGGKSNIIKETKKIS